MAQRDDILIGLYNIMEAVGLEKYLLPVIEDVRGLNESVIELQERVEKLEEFLGLAEEDYED